MGEPSKIQMAQATKDDMFEGRAEMVSGQMVSGQYNSSTQLELGFWQKWQEHQDLLYRCCLKWMKGNPTEAEDALSAAMLKAMEKLQESTQPIENFQAWLTKLTYNLCMDLLRKRDRSAFGVEDLDTMAPSAEWAHQKETPELVLMGQDLTSFLNRAIDSLPPRLRDTFVLYFQKQQSYREIAIELDISYTNVRKRVSQARAILREQLQEYQGEGATPVVPSKKGSNPKLAVKSTQVDLETSQEIIPPEEKQLALAKAEEPLQEMKVETREEPHPVASTHDANEELVEMPPVSDVESQPLLDQCQVFGARNEFPQKEKDLGGVQCVSKQVPGKNLLQHSKEIAPLVAISNQLFSMTGNFCCCSVCNLEKRWAATAGNSQENALPQWHRTVFLGLGKCCEFEFCWRKILHFDSLRRSWADGGGYFSW